jgi:high-affinity nickel permease
MTVRTACRISLWLGSLSLLAVLAANLALHDIYHKEVNVALEWEAVRISFVIIVVFHLCALGALWKAQRETTAVGSTHGSN